MVLSDMFVNNSVTAFTFLTFSNRKGKKLQILVSLSESKIDHTGCNATSIIQIKVFKAASSPSVGKATSVFSMRLESDRLTLHTTAQSTMAAFVMFQRAKAPECAEGLYLRVTKARYLGLRMPNQ